jgi:hypothetical protein
MIKLKAEDFHAMPAVIAQWRSQGPALSGIYDYNSTQNSIYQSECLLLLIYRLAATWCWLRMDFKDTDLV